MKFVFIKNQLIVDKDNILNVEVKPNALKQNLIVVFTYKNGSTSSHELEETSQEELATSIRNHLNV